MCEKPLFNGIYNKIDYSRETNELLADKIFLQEAVFHLGKLFEGVDRLFQDRLHTDFRTEEKLHYYSKEEY